MVAPHVQTPLTRSLVRVPNSGRDRSAGAVLHDLSRVSSAAAMVPITNYLALGLLSSALSPRQPPSPQHALNQAIMRKLASSSSGTHLHPPRTANRNGAVPRGMGTTSRPWSVPNPHNVPTTSGATGLPTRDASQSGAAGGVGLSQGSSTHFRGGRKRSLPGSSGRSSGPSISPKVPRDTRTTGRTPRNSPQHQQAPQTLPAVELVTGRDEQLRSLSNQRFQIQAPRPIEGM